MKHIWPITIVLVACGAVAASAEPGPAAKDGEAPRAASASTPPAAAPTSTAKGNKGDADTKDGGALQASSLFGAKTMAPWRGSQFVYKNSFSAISLSPAAELTYNPTYTMTFSFRPWWWFTKSLYVRASLDVDREITEADGTTKEGEAWVRDLRLVVGLSNILRIPKAKIDFSFSLVLTVPTSKISWARTMVLGIGPGVRVSRMFKVLKGLIIGYNVRAAPTFHRYTTSQTLDPRISGCSGTVGGCDSFYNTGLRNSMVRLTHYGDISVRFLKWMGVSLAIGQATDWLYPLSDSEIATYQPEYIGEDRRWLTFLELQVAFQPLKMLEIAVGYSSVHPQLAPDGQRYVPFFNRYSAFYIDLKLKIDGLVARIQRSVKK